MNKMAKVAVTIVVVIVFLLLFGLLGLYCPQIGIPTQIQGILGVSLLAVLSGVLCVVWAKDESGNRDNNSSVLQK